MLEGLKKMLLKDKVDLSIQHMETLDLGLLEQKEYHFLFDHNNCCHWPLKHNYALTDQRFYMWQQGHMPGTPHLILRNNVHEALRSRRARVVGKIHTVTSSQIIELDKKMRNGVRYERRQVRFLLPGYVVEPPKARHDATRPPMAVAWIYIDSEELWTPRLKFDAEFFRGRKDSVFTPVRTRLDNDQAIGPYFLPVRGSMRPDVAQTTSMWKSQEYKDFKFKVEQEDRHAREREEDNNKKKEKHVENHYYLSSVS